MKLVQLNIWGGKLQYQIPDFLNQQLPDIVCMQEVCDLKGLSGAMFAPLEEIKAACDFDHSFMAPTYSWKYMQRELDYGNAILSRHALENRRVIFTRGTYKKGFDITIDDYNIRNFQHTVVDCGGNKVHILNHHGHHLTTDKQGNGETQLQTNLIADYIDKLSGAIILAGDFNLAPNSPSLDVIKSRLRDLCQEHSVSNTYSELSIHQVVCDYIFVNNQVKVDKFYVPKSLVSDHMPLVLEFSV